MITLSNSSSNITMNEPLNVYVDLDNVTGLEHAFVSKGTQVRFKQNPFISVSPQITSMSLWGLAHYSGSLTLKHRISNWFHKNFK